MIYLGLNSYVVTLDAGGCESTHTHTLTDARFHVGEAGLGEVPQQSEGALPHLWHRILSHSKYQDF